MKQLFQTFSWLVVLGAGVMLFAEDDLAVVVNKSNPVDNLTKAQLRKIVLGEQPTWSTGRKVSVILRTPGQPEREGVLHGVCGIGEDEFTQHLMHADFNGENAAPPKALGSAEAVRQLVVTIPGGIGFLKVADVNESVKTVKVDGLAAGQPGYKIKVGR
jgi:phosphate transport system substrate-binding protein